jgi:hypothetical protein
MADMEQAPLKVVLTNIRQMLTCLSLLVLAGIEWRFHQDLALPPWLATAAGFVLAGVAPCLLAWNAIDGFRELGAGRHRLPAALLAMLYLSVTILGVHAFPSLVLRK